MASVENSGASYFGRVEKHKETEFLVPETADSYTSSLLRYYDSMTLSPADDQTWTVDAATIPAEN